MKKVIYSFIFLFCAVLTLQAETMVVATYNLRNANGGDSTNGNGWGQRYPYIAQIVQFHGFDIFGTQEGKYPQLQDLRQAMPGYDYIGVGRDDGKRAGEHSAIFYRTDKFEVLEHGDFWLSEITDRPNKGWDAVLPRICTWGEFRDKQTGFTFLFFNLHMDHVGVQARAESAKLITSDIDERDHPFIDRASRTDEGFHPILPGRRMEYCIARGLAFAPYADLLWMETSTPDLDQARRFAEAIHREFPGKLLAYNCSPSFNWKARLDDATIAKFQRELGAMGYKFQFITLAGFHSLNYATFELARGYAERQMAAYVELQQAELAAEAEGYTATRHQREVGTGYFDLVSLAISGGRAATTALGESTEASQFH